MKAPDGSLLTIGFGTTVAMWFVGYVGRLPALLLPSPVLVALMLGCALFGGVVLGRCLGRNPPAAAATGAIISLLNLLILGSLLGGERPGIVVPAAVIWVPGSIVLTVGLVLVGSLAGARSHRAGTTPVNWSGAFAWVAVAATSLLLAIGGIVTSAEAGLAVVDWPTSFGYNMFLYPFSQMTGGIFYEHAHRLMGALVGLTTVVFAVVIQRSEDRGWIRALAWIAVAAVVIQGLLGGLRVTERNLAMAMTHGVLAQLFFSTLVALAIFTSRAWKAATPPLRRRGVSADRVVSGALVGLIVVQLVLGAAQRHFQQVLIPHILVGLAVVTPLCVHVGFRTWGMNPELPRMRRLGLALVGLVGIQVLLGFGAYLATRGTPAAGLPAPADLVVSTLHQWTGAVLLALVVTVFSWNFRLIGPLPAVPADSHL
jgi:cytochrome c oxidase assembly protein subunit 15